MKCVKDLNDLNSLCVHGVAQNRKKICNYWPHLVVCPGNFNDDQTYRARQLNEIKKRRKSLSAALLCFDTSLCQIGGSIFIPQVVSERFKKIEEFGSISIRVLQIKNCRSGPLRRRTTPRLPRHNRNRRGQYRPVDDCVPRRQSESRLPRTESALHNPVLRVSGGC
jgi:hypothetical protein